MDWQLLASNTVALAAIIAPLIVESRRQKKEAVSIANEKKKLDELKKDDLVIDYISSLNSFYEALEGESEVSKIVLKNQSSVIKNKIFFEFEVQDLWRTEIDRNGDKINFDSNFDELFKYLKNKIKDNDFEISLINVIDITQNILQVNCDENDDFSDCRKELKILLEILPIIQSGYKFQMTNQKIKFQEKDRGKQSILFYIDSYLDEVKEYQKLEEFYKIKETDKSVSEYYKRIFETELKDNPTFIEKFQKAIEENNQIGKIHKSLISNSQANNYTEVKINNVIYYVNKNCRRTSAENFIIRTIKPLVEEN